MLQLLLRALACTLLIQLSENTTGFRVITVVNDDEDSSNNSLHSKSCMERDCSYYSFHWALSNLTSNSLVNITTNVRLSLIMSLVDLANISIRGHQNPTVNCTTYGGLDFASCHNLTIEGVTWEGCGKGIISNNGNAYPVLHLYNSTNVIIKNCTFQYSLGQVVVFSKVTESVNINYCNFLSNKYYKGNGVALHYSDLSNSFQHNNAPLYLTITGCRFYYNEGAKSVVYFGPTANKIHTYLHLQNSSFHLNKAVPIYLCNQDLQIDGNVEFYNNVAESGGGIFINHSNIVFCKGSTINFANNTATSYGGAIFITNHSSIVFAENHTLSDPQCVRPLHSTQNFEIMITFDSNRANKFGGAIYTNNSDLVFGKRATVVFSKNEAIYDGGAMCIEMNSVAIFQENSTAKFYKNKAGWGGGAILIMESSLTFEGDTMVTLNNNTADDGGAVYIYYSSNVTLTGNSAVMFHDNKAHSFCGAVYMINSTASFKRNSTITFNYNHANGSGGAACFDTSNITFVDNSTAVFYYNKAADSSGAVLIYMCIVEFEGYSTISFYGNKADFGGAVVVGGLSIVILEENSAVTFYDNIANIAGGAVYIRNSRFTFRGYTKVIFHTNKADYGGAVYICLSSNVSFSENSTVTFHHNFARKLCGAVFITDSTPIVEQNATIKFKYNHANAFGGALCIANSNITFEGNSFLTFNHNDADSGGGAMLLIGMPIVFEQNATLLLNDIENFQATFYKNSSITFTGNTTIMLNSNTANVGGAVFIGNLPNFIIKGNSQLIFSDNKANSYGGAMCIDSSSATFDENSAVKFNNNRANSGGAVFITNSSVVLFEGKSTVTFYNNEAYVGGAMFITISIVSFGGNSLAIVYSNKATGFSFTGGAMCIENSTVIFDSNSAAAFYNNTANNCGGALLAVGSNTTVKGNSTVTFINNQAVTGGGAACIVNNSNIIFTANSTAIFDNNEGTLVGGAMSSPIGAAITFEGNSTVVFNNNGAYTGGALYVGNYCTVTFRANSTVSFNKNEAFSGGALCTDIYSNATFEGSSMVTFSNNRADYSVGGAIYNLHYSTIVVQGNSTVTFSDNTAVSGGALCLHNATMTFKENSIVLFNNNQASTDGGAVCISNSSVIIEGKSAVTFLNNAAIHGSGGAVYINRYSTLSVQEDLAERIFRKNGTDNRSTAHIHYYSTVIFQESSTSVFISNIAYNGGAIYAYNNALVTFQGHSTTTFNNNTAIQGGGVFYSYAYCKVSFQETCTVIVGHNKALQGGAIYLQLKSHIRFEGNSTIKFTDNAAVEYGGVIKSFTNTLIIFTDYVRVTFDHNNAKRGGVVYSDNSFITVTENSGTAFSQAVSNITFAGNSSVIFTNNTALQDGGSIYLSDHSTVGLVHNSNVTFCHNTANDYGGAIYVQFKEDLINFNISNIHFVDNSAGTINKSVYINVLKPCRRNCLLRNTKGINTKNFSVATSPSKLVLYDPARCINGTDMECDTYFMNKIMLGQEITLNACLLDYYDQPAETTQFFVTSTDHRFKISSSKYFSISCNHTTQGTIIIGDLNKENSYNYSMVISMYVVRISESKAISVNLKVELSHCHLGFYYSKETQKCECYNTSRIVSCSDSSSTIKRGYWFGSVTGKSTITMCPNDYCNFTCCEITNGIYHLSPVRTNQCKLYRSGVACGNCDKGYTLSFDSTQCIEMSKCTTGQIVLVTTLSLLYWICVIIVVFVIMYFKVPVGSLYAIVYYYSVLDIILYQDYFVLSGHGLYTVISIMSSLAKLTPQFLGQLCLVKNTSGIDQQFIHYIHPVAVSFFLITVSMIARRSHRFSLFISRAVIHFICFLLLLSYTSVATTSLLLMRPLTFMDVDKVYTYLSPDIEYFHGRHIVYIIAAILLTVVIVISLPLLLLLEPFLNSKINFVKMKPLLDQFQGSYKDKYRCFAAYYMICRIVIILLVIVRVFDDFTTQYLLLIVCALMALIHLIIKPYVQAIDNIFDGIILQLIVMIAVLPIVEFVDNYNAMLVLVVTYLLIMLPLASFITIKLLVHKTEIKNVINNAIKYCFKRCSRQIEHNITTDDMELPINEIGITIDDSMRRNATIVPPV